jgi:hypothetical protein
MSLLCWDVHEGHVTGSPRAWCRLENNMIGSDGARALLALLVRLPALTDL